MSSVCQQPGHHVSQDDSRKAELKRSLRSRFRARRSELERVHRRALAAELNQHLLARDVVTGAETVGGFLAFDGEPDLRFTLTQLSRRGIGVALPVLPDQENAPLQWRAWTPATPLRPNRFGISEPVGTPTIRMERIDTLLIPLVAWDRLGTRLGMGGGWYDRCLAQPSVTARRVGVAWSLQEAKEPLPRETWDAALDEVVTERGWFTCPRGTATMTTTGTTAPS